MSKRSTVIRAARSLLLLTADSSIIILVFSGHNKAQSSVTDSNKRMRFVVLEEFCSGSSPGFIQLQSVDFLSDRIGIHSSFR